jgi:hypothetical protein
MKGEILLDIAGSSMAEAILKEF